MTTKMDTPTTVDECRAIARRHVAELDVLLTQARDIKQRLSAVNEEFLINLEAAASLYPTQKVRSIDDLIRDESIDSAAELADSMVMDIERGMDMIGKYMLPDEYKIDGDGLLDIIKSLEDGGQDILRIEPSGAASVMTDRAGVYAAVGVLDPTTLRRFLELQPLMLNSYFSEGFYFVNAPEDAVLTLTTAQDKISELPPGYVFLTQDVFYGDYVVIAAVQCSDIVVDYNEDIEEMPDLRNGYFPLGSIHVDDVDLLSGMRTVGYRNGTHELMLFNWQHLPQ